MATHLSETLHISRRVDAGVDTGDVKSLEAWLDGQTLLLILALLAFVLPFLVIIALRRALWFDEIFTVTISRLSIDQLWKTLSTNVDAHPPVTYVLTHASLRLFGDGSFSARLPSIFGFCLMAVCVFRYVAFRTGAAWGFLAALLPFASDAVYYGSEARPYGLLLGFSALALVTWQHATADRHRIISLFGLVIAIVLAVSTHYYALLLAFPLLTAELTRCCTRRKVDWPVLLCSTLPFALFVIYLPLVLHLVQIYKDNAWNPPTLKGLYSSYQYVFPGLAPVLLAVIVVCLPVSYLLRQIGASENWPLLPPLHEWIAALALALIPFPAYVIAVLKTHQLYPRYVLPLLVGCAILFGFACYQIWRARVAYAVAAAMCLLSWMTIMQVQTIRSLPEPDFGCPSPPLTGPTVSLPVVIDDSKAALRCWFYAKPPLKSRIVFVADPEEATTVGLSNSIQNNLLIAGDVLHFPVVPYKPFRAAHHEFFLSKGVDGEARWVLAKYLQNRADVRLFQGFPNELYLVKEAPE